MTEQNHIPQAAKPFCEQALPQGATPLCDLHCHLGFTANPQEVAGEAEAAGTLLFSNTVTPQEWLNLAPALKPYSNVTVGFGMHPWWVGEIPVADVLQALEQHNPEVIGEIGLDFGPRHKDSAEAQRAMLRAILQWVADKGAERLLCLHAVHSAGEVFEMLEETGALESCRCLFHWFSGPSDLLKRAIDAGCYISCGPRMLATGKGREYVKTIPADQLLLETDAPPSPLTEEPFAFAEQLALLEKAAEGVADIKGPEALVAVRETSLRLLS